MDTKNLLVRYGNPKNWNNTNLYDKWLVKEKFDAEFSKLIEDEINERGGIEKVKKTAEEEKQKKEETERGNAKKKKRTSIVTIASITLVLSILILYLFLSKEQRLYNSASKNQSITACKQFLQKCPKSVYILEIKDKYLFLVLQDIYKDNNKDNRTYLLAEMGLKENENIEDFINNTDILKEFEAADKRLKIVAKEFNQMVYGKIKNDQFLMDFFQGYLDSFNKSSSVQDVDFYDYHVKQYIKDEIGLDLLKK